VGPDDLTFAQIADHLGLHKESVGRMARKGVLPARRVPGKGRDGAKRISRAALAAAIAQWTVPAERNAA
jgi:excisionase family DNA binding protein